MVILTTLVLTYLLSRIYLLLSDLNRPFAHYLLFSVYHISCESSAVSQLADHLLLECFIRKGAPIEYSTNGFTPLMYAAALGHWHSVKSLIAAGANLNAQDKQGWTALHWATDAGNSIPSKDIQKQGGHWRSVMVCKEQIYPTTA